MNKSDLIAGLSAETGLDIAKAEVAVNKIFDSISDALVKGERVELRGFCTFSVKGYGEYIGRNPKTGEPIEIKPRKLPFFRCGKELKERVQTGQPGIRRSEPRNIIDEFYSVEFSTREVNVLHQFKIWNLSRKGICVLAREGSAVLKHLKVGEILNMRYYKIDLPEPSDYTKTEIRHITREKEGRFKGHYLIGLAFLEGQSG